MTNQKKIDIFVKRTKYNDRLKRDVTAYVYECSTTQARTCKEAIARYSVKYGVFIEDIKANFSTFRSPNIDPDFTSLT